MPIWRPCGSRTKWSGFGWKAPRGRRVSKGFVDACRSFGLPPNEDYNDGENWGVACAQTNTRRGMRWSAARAYLHPALKRPNLTVLTNAVVSRVLVENNRATGVTYHCANVASESENAAYAQREIVLSAGALHSPHLLELSGIGDGQHLRERAGATRSHRAGGAAGPGDRR
ncbi:MAG: GMC family oxidoreductase N-terminal domain-containing protein [Alphaproteobacteria bacterium]|nr:GMC family oxidoreductase N-terminal domain-containing protein [Alphaproteobacteria bacterium]